MIGLLPQLPPAKPLIGGARWLVVLALCLLSAPSVSPAQDLETEIGTEAFALEAEDVDLEPKSPAESPAPPPTSLTVAILDLATAPDLLPAPRVVAQPTWRTTFGSERQTLPQPAPNAREILMSALSEVDAVLIQGVRSARPLRRIFPARYWRIVIARSAGGASGAASGEAMPATAIAIRARHGLRVTARTHALEPMASMPDGVMNGDRTGLRQDPSATAIRLSDRGRSIWLASIALPHACAGEDPPCPTLLRLDGWRQEKRGGGEPALIGGRVSPRTATDEPTNACAAYAIEGDLAWERLPSDAAGISPEPGKGCIVILRVAEAK